MKKVGGLFTCSALALMAFAALPLSAAELTHRWSFNGDYSDSAAGRTPRKREARGGRNGNAHIGTEPKGENHPPACREREWKMKQGRKRTTP